MLISVCNLANPPGVEIASLITSLETPKLLNPFAALNTAVAVLLRLPMTPTLRSANSLCRFSYSLASSEFSSIIICERSKNPLANAWKSIPIIQVPLLT